jgi:hypothetical protein
MKKSCFSIIANIQRYWFVRAKFNTGNALAEYVLPTSLIALAMLPLLPPLVTNIGQMVQNTLLNSNIAGSALHVTPFSNTATNVSSTIISSEGASNPPITTSEVTSVTLDDGSTSIIDTSNLSANNLAKLIETTGVNGMTTALSSYLEQLAQQLVNTGELTQGQANELIILAQRGHDIANAQAALETFIAQHPGSDFYTAPITYKGITYSSIDSFNWTHLNNAGTWQDLSQSLDIGQSNNGRMGKSIISFMSQFRTAANSSAMSNPAVFKLVNQLSANIVGAAGSQHVAVTSLFLTYHGSRDVSKRAKVGADASFTSPSQINGLLSSLVTQTNSNGICSVGGGSSSNNSCH